MSNENKTKQDGLIVLKTPEAINAFRVLALKSALSMEIQGLKRRGRSVYSIVKEEFGFKGNRQKVLAQLEEYIETEVMK